MTPPNQPEPSAQNIEQRFQFAETLGFGGMATVHRAFDTLTQRDVAIKVLHPHLRENPTITQHFRQEYTIAQTLEHPNIVRIHSIIDTPKMLALVMERHGTHDLKEHLQHHGKMSHHQVLNIANQILSALEAAHDQNIIHHDIKPHNILWDPTTKTAKLIDFGLAQLPQSGTTTPESAMATVEYSAPEQFDDFGTDHRADLYSLAITLFELLSNTLPYRADSAAAGIQMHQNAPIADVRVFARATPDPIALTLMRAMAKAPEDRFENATQMRKSLTQESQTTPQLPPQSTEWNELKTYNRTRLANATTRLQTNNQNDWNLYLPPLHHKAIDKTGHQQQTRFIQAFVHLFQSHSPNYHGDLNLNAPNNLAGFDIPHRVDSIETHYPTLFSKNQHPLQFSTQLNTWNPVPLASGLTFDQAERIRYELGKDGIIARAFQLNIHNPTTPLATPWQRLARLRHLPTHLNTFTLLLLIATSFITIRKLSTTFRQNT